MKVYTMTQGEFDEIVQASQPVRYMVFDGQPPRSPQENANAAWRRLGNKYGFDYMTVKPHGNSGVEFEAEPT